MEEVGVIMSGHRSKSTREVPFDSMDLVVTLCDSARGSCPALPAGCRGIHWSLRDPASVQGTPEEVRRAFREVREDVLACVKRLMFELAMNQRRPRG
jgi:arsenate reductase